MPINLPLEVLPTRDEVLDIIGGVLRHAWRNHFGTLGNCFEETLEQNVFYCIDQAIPGLLSGHLLRIEQNGDTRERLFCTLPSGEVLFIKKINYEVYLNTCDEETRFKQELRRSHVYKKDGPILKTIEPSPIFRQYPYDREHYIVERIRPIAQEARNHPCLGAYRAYCDAKMLQQQAPHTSPGGARPRL